jgi:hypothetical protein
MVDAHPAPDDFAGNLAQVRARLAAALKEAGRADPVEIIAVAKSQESPAIRRALEAGHRVFGENRVQEAQRKWPDLRRAFADVELHLIGPLQSNKAAEAVSIFDVIQTIDRPKIAAAVSAEMRRHAKPVRLLVQINTGEEPQKSGVAPAQADAFIEDCRRTYGLDIAGLMCIPPAAEAPAPHFALLAKIADRNRLPLLSMGMSGDYEIAAQLGATHVRIGTALFGPRPKADEAHGPVRLF